MVFTDHPQPRFTMPYSTEGIQSLTEINGIPIHQIERIMKSHDSKYSSTGFLGQNESLIEVLSRDSETVQALGVSHNQIASDISHLFLELHYPPMSFETQGMTGSRYSEYIRNRKNTLGDGIFVHLNNKNFLVSYTSYDHDSVSSSITSPMGDGYVSSSDEISVFDVDALRTEYGVEIASLADYYQAYQQMKIPDLNTCKRTIPRIMIHLIGSYGFYEGIESRFRLDPKDLVEFLHIRPVEF